MHPDIYLTVHRQHERELVRDLELRRAAGDCPGCVVRARRSVAALDRRARARFRRAGPLTRPACGSA